MQSSSDGMERRFGGVSVMALETQVIQLPIVGGIDTKTDDRTVQPTKLSKAENVFMNNMGRMEKRYGYIDTAEPFSGTGRAIWSQGDKTFELQNGRINERKSDGSWATGINTGNDTTGLHKVEIDEVLADTSSKLDPDYVTVGGYNIYVWQSLNVGAFVFVTDATTGAIRIDKTNLSATGTNIRVAIVGSNALILYADGSNLKAVTFTSSTVTLSSSTTIASDLRSTGAIDMVSYDSGACAFAYQTTTTTNAKIGYLKSDRTVGNGVNGYPATITASDANGYVNTCFSIFYHSDANQLWIFYSYSQTGPDLYGIKGHARTATTLVSSVAAFAIESNDGNFNTCFRIGCVRKDATSMYLVWDRAGGSSNDQFLSSLRIHGFPYYSVVRYCTLTTAGSVSGTATLKSNCNLASHPFTSNSFFSVWVIYSGETYYDISSGIFNSTTQNTFYCVVFAAPSGYATGVSSKVFQSSAIVRNFLYLPSYGGIPIAGFEFKWGVLPRVTIQTNGAEQKCSVTLVRSSISSTLPFRIDPRVRTQGTTASTQIDLVSADFRNTSYGNTRSINTEEKTLIGENILLEHDSNLVSESGFHTFPETLYVESGNLSISTSQQGTGALPEKSFITCVPAFRLFTGDYIDLYNAANVLKRVVITVTGHAGIGTVTPADISVTLDPSDDEYEVAEKFKVAIDAHADFIATRTFAIVNITNAANGACTDAGVSLASTARFTNGTELISAGIYNWIAIYEYIDQLGNVYQSAPSIPVSSNLTVDTESVTVLVPALTLTDKIKNKPTIKLYRTLRNGSIYYLTGVAEQPVFNDETKEWVAFRDFLSDNIISLNEILYTTGGVLENINPPSVKTFHVSKDRVWIRPVESKNTVWFSKKKQDGYGISFNDTLTMRVEPISGEITAISSIDDKPIFFEREAILFTSGVGPDDLGSGSFSEPEVISKDIGCPFDKSLASIPDGTIFKSLKGWYLLNRGLGLEYIGADVEAFNGLTVSKVVVIPNRHQVRIIHSDGDMLVYDYFYKQWSNFTHLYGNDAMVITSQDLTTSTFYLLRDTGKLWTEDASTEQDPA